MLPIQLTQSDSQIVVHQGKGPIDFTPSDVIKLFFIYVPLRQISQLRLVCKRWRRLVDQMKITPVSHLGQRLVFQSKGEQKHPDKGEVRKNLLTLPGVTQGWVNAEYMDIKEIYDTCLWKEFLAILLEWRCEIWHLNPHRLPKKEATIHFPDGMSYPFKVSLTDEALRIHVYKNIIFEYRATVDRTIGERQYPSPPRLSHSCTLVNRMKMLPHNVYVKKHDKMIFKDQLVFLSESSQCLCHYNPLRGELVEFSIPPAKGRNTKHYFFDELSPELISFWDFNDTHPLMYHLGKKTLTQATDDEKKCVSDKIGKIVDKKSLLTTDHIITCYGFSITIISRHEPKKILKIDFSLKSYVGKIRVKEKEIVAIMYDKIAVYNEDTGELINEIDLTMVLGNHRGIDFLEFFGNGVAFNFTPWEENENEQFAYWDYHSSQEIKLFLAREKCIDEYGVCGNWAFSGTGHHTDFLYWNGKEIEHVCTHLRPRNSTIYRERRIIQDPVSNRLHYIQVAWDFTIDHYIVESIQ